MSKRILVLTFYFRPDLCAGAFRTTPLVDALLEADPDALIDVVTTSPNRYNSFTSAAPTEEQQGRVRIRRIALPAHQSGMRDQSRAFMYFFRGAMRLVRGERYDLVYATSSRLMTAALGSLFARRLKAPLYLDIRDIFVDTMAEVLPSRIAPLVTPMLGMLERWTVNAASRVNLVSPGFAEYFGTRYPKQSFACFTNGIDDEFLTANAGGAHSPGPRVTVLYAGNIGEGQGLHSILPELAKRLADRADFLVIGDGSRRAQLEVSLAAAGVTNVTFRPPVARAELIREYQNADVLLLHLNDYDAFKKVLPSKIFEYAALGKPIWAGVSGYAARFLEEEVSNAAVFPPCDAAAGIDAFARLAIHDAPRPEFIAKYQRARIMREMATDILRHARTT